MSVAYGSKGLEGSYARNWYINICDLVQTQNVTRVRA